MIISSNLEGSGRRTSVISIKECSSENYSIGSTGLNQFEARISDFWFEYGKRVDWVVNRVLAYEEEN